MVFSSMYNFHFVSVSHCRHSLSTNVIVEIAIIMTNVLKKTNFLFWGFLTFNSFQTLLFFFCTIVEQAFRLRKQLSLSLKVVVFQLILREFNSCSSSSCLFFSTSSVLSAKKQNIYQSKSQHLILKSFQKDSLKTKCNYKFKQNKGTP